MSLQELQEDLADAQFASNVRAAHIEELKRELRDAKRMLWSAVYAAGGEVRINESIFCDTPDGLLTVFKDDANMQTVVRAKRATRNLRQIEGE